MLSSKISKVQGITFISNNVLDVSVYSSLNPSGSAENGQIVIQATGGRPPYLYSIDFGNTYQKSNVFNGLGGNLHKIQVKDQFNNYGWVAKTLAENIVCGDYNGSIWSDLFGLKWNQLYNCKWDDLI